MGRPTRRAADNGLPALVVERRAALGLNQRQLASRLGVRQQSVSRWETGFCSPDTGKLLLLGEVLGVSKTTLLRAAGLLEGDEVVAGPDEVVVPEAAA